MKAWIILVYLTATIYCGLQLKPFDFIEDALSKYRNQSVHPCENFYRHACSFDSPENGVIAAAFGFFNEYVKKTQTHDYFWKLALINDYKTFEKRIELLDSEKAMTDFFRDAVNTTCETDKEAATKLAKMVLKAVADRDELPNKPLLHENSDDCYFLTNVTRKYVSRWLRDFSASEETDAYQKRVVKLQQTLVSISVHLDMDVREGIEQTHDLVESVRKIGMNLIKDTPWIKNNKFVERIEYVTSKLKIYDNYGKDFRDITDALVSAEKFYVECKATFSRIEDNDIMCYILTLRTNPIPDDKTAFFLYNNAFNMHPYVVFGFPNYYYAQHGKEMASKLGYTGQMVGHEIGHTFFDNHDNIQWLPYFSKNVENCVQNQFNSTCAEFVEKSCEVTDGQLEENGADIFGLQMAYKLLEDYYGSKLKDNIERLQMTYEQLFFYSYAVQSCFGAESEITLNEYGYREEHSVKNVRVNVLVQLPAFKEAFNCSADSKMMRSATEQCQIYGSRAPESKTKQ